jgi:hypothetical protein
VNVNTVFGFIILFGLVNIANAWEALFIYAHIAQTLARTNVGCNSLGHNNMYFSHARFNLNQRVTGMGG